MRDRPISRPTLTRRGALGAGALAASSALAGCSSPLGAGLVGSELSPGTLVYWNLFGGGDGGRMKSMEDVYRQEQGDPSSLQATTFAWGNPYYSKVTLATVGNQPPDVAIAHLTRAKPLWDGGLLEAITEEDLAGVGLSSADFNAKAWEAQVTDGKNVAIPLDTHPFVMFFNRAVLEPAGLLESDGRITDLSGIDTFEAALAEISAVTGGIALAVANVSENATPWRFFWSLYNQYDGAAPFLADGGTSITVDEEIFADIMHRVETWVENGWLNRTLDYAGSQTEMFVGNAGLYLQGEWEISTAQSVEGLDFGMAPIPTLFDRPANQGDSHTFILPRKDRSPEDRARAMGFIASLLGQSMTWAEGGHVPTYLPTFESAEYTALLPQADYASAADNTYYDDPAWYGGSGSTFENTVGPQLGLVQQGTQSPEDALAHIRAQLDVYLSTPSPL